MRVYQRYVLEYILLGLVATLGIVLGARDPMHLGAPHATSGQFSIGTIFVGNLLTVVCILVGSMFSGGFLGVIIIFVNMLFYGRVLHAYTQTSLWTAIFPWLEFVALLIATQVGSDVFWSLLRGWPLSLRRVALWTAMCPLLLFAAALIEGGILHV